MDEDLYGLRVFVLMILTVLFVWKNVKTGHQLGVKLIFDKTYYNRCYSDTLKILPYSYHPF